MCIRDRSVTGRRSPSGIAKVGSASGACAPGASVAWPTWGVACCANMFCAVDRARPLGQQHSDKSAFSSFQRCSAALS
eukprot:4805000-Alexandrium_andersonii.AAC.1